MQVDVDASQIEVGDDIRLGPIRLVKDPRQIETDSLVELAMQSLGAS